MRISPEDYLDYEEGKFWRRIERPRRRKKRQPTAADKARREEEIRRAKEARVGEAEEKIKSHLLKFPGLETEEGKNQVEKYIKWVEDSLQLNGAQFNPDDKDEVRIDYLVSSVKAGGQHRQKSQSAVRVTHLPTRISVQNQEERIAELNKKRAIEILAQRLEDHLEFWRTLIKNSSVPINVKEKVASLL